MDYSDMLGTLSNTATCAKNVDTYHIVGMVLGILAAVLGYYLFVKPEKKYDNKFVNWLRKFLNFNAETVEGLLKMLYILAAVYSCVTSINMINIDFLKFLETLVISQVIIRVVFELAMVSVHILKEVKGLKKTK